MGQSGVYGKTDDAQSAAVIHAAIERGVTFLDTGDHYGAIRRRRCPRSTVRGLSHHQHSVVQYFTILPISAASGAPTDRSDGLAASVTLVS